MTAPAADDLAELRERLERREGRAQVRAQARSRKAVRVSQQRLAEVRQRALLAGERARVRHTVSQSGEARALRVERTRTTALLMLLPVLAAFGAWSAAGVQAGMVKLLHLAPGETAAYMAWLVEPALLGTVAGIILIRANLRNAGGDLDERATKIEFGALSVSILLNMAGHWPDSLNGSGLAALAGHALGPVGAAGTAYLISVVQDGVSRATPWLLADGRPAPSLKALDDDPASTPHHTAESGSGSGSGQRTARPVTQWPVPSGARALLPLVSLAAAPKSAPETARRSVPDQRRQQVSEAPQAGRRSGTRKRSGTGRADKGTRVPASARKSASKSTPRTQTDEELAARLAALVAAGDVDPSASVRTVQSVLGIGWERAKRIHALTATATAAPGAVGPARLRAVPTATRPETANDSAMAAAVVPGGDAR